MTRYYVEVHYRLPDADKAVLDRHIDSMLDELHEADGLVDPDVGGNYHKRTVTVCSMVDAPNEGDALNKTLAGVRSAVHGIGDSTPGWEWSDELVSGLVRLPDMVDV